jgi:hypothetical protein
MQEILKGRGQLEDWQAPHGKHEVDYHFEIVTEIVERQGFPPVAGRRRSKGNIVSTVGDRLPEGEYRLYAEDGEVLKVKNLGFVWAILSS